MERETEQRLLHLNRQFYQTFAREFSATRQRLQPGVQLILEKIPSTARVLDLGCGNGALWRQLQLSEHTGGYTGLDFSAELLQVARESSREDHRLGPEGKPRFLQVDLASPDWDASLTPESFDICLAFAVLHHLPGAVLRQQVLRKVYHLLSSAGQFIHSEWQFLNSPRLRKRIHSWEEVGLSEENVEPNDYLLDWRRGGFGLRYVHYFDERELSELAEQTGFRVLDTFYSDGEGSRLGLYQVWEKISPPRPDSQK